MAAGQVEFHTGVPDVQAFACRLLRKASRAGATVLCLAPADRLPALDRALWTFVERDFVPHLVQAGASPRLLARTPIWLAPSWPAGGRWPEGLPARDVLLDLGGAWPIDDVGPAALAGTLRLIEVVGQEPEEVERGRALWRQCKAAGLEVVHHPFAAVREG